MRYLLITTIAIGVTLSLNAQQSPVRTSDPSAARATANTSSTAPLRTTDIAPKTTTSAAVQEAPLRTSDEGAPKTNRGAIQPVPLRTSDPDTAKSAAADQKASQQKKTVVTVRPAHTSRQPGPVCCSAGQNYYTQ